MRKNKEWLQKELQKKIDQPTIFYSPLVSERKIVYREIINLIDQLEEPNKVIVPQFMAESLEKAANDGVTLMQLMGIANSHLELDEYKEEYDWIRKYHETFAKAWIYGWEVEEEKLYTIKLPQTDGVFANYTGDEFKEWEIMGERAIIGNSDWKYTFTESEIKAIDERYWVFAEEVAE